jgi:hypothetical protein
MSSAQSLATPDPKGDVLSLNGEVVKRVGGISLHSIRAGVIPTVATLLFEFLFRLGGRNELAIAVHKKFVAAGVWHL